MAFLRRGNVKRPHKDSAFVLLHRFDGTPIKMSLKAIQCWEEYKHRNLSPVTMVYWGMASATAVRESFDEIDQAVNGEAVPS